MTKFKVGDRVRNISNREYGIGNVGTITNKCDGEVETSFEEGYYWNYTEWMELIEPDSAAPKTYTLTPYIKPETVTINGVEYIMTENV